MDESHDDQNFRCKIKKIWSKTYVFCCNKYPIHTSIVISLFLLYLFFPLLFNILIYTSPLVGLSLLVHRVLSDINHQKIKQAEEDARRKKFAKSRRSFKSIYSDRGNLVQRNTLNKSDNIDTNAGDNDDVFLKSLHELLSEKKPKDIGNFESVVGKGEGSSLNSNVNSNINTEKDDFKGESWDVSENDDKRKDHKVVRWTDDHQKNDLDLGLSEADRNKRLESLMVRRRSRKNLGFEEKGSTENDNNVQIPKVKTKKINPFLEDKSSGNKSPGSAPSSLLKTSNPFDLPYDPHEEKLDLTGDNFHEEFTVSDHPKEPVLCRHQSFSLGALSRSAIGHGKHDIPYYKHLSNKKKSIIGFDTSTLDYKHILQDSSISDDSTDSNHSKEEEEEEEDDGAEKEIDSYAARKADINFFYGRNKRVLHAVSHSMVSDMQVELSDEETAPTLDDLDIEKVRQSWLNPSNSQADLEMNENPKPLNSDTIQSNHVHEPHGASQSSVAQAAQDGLTELAVGPASVSSSSPKSVLHHTDGDSDEHPFGDRDIDNLQDQNAHQL